MARRPTLGKLAPTATEPSGTPAPLYRLARIARSLKSTPPSSKPKGGMITSDTNDDTILPKAAPIMIPTAISTTLPRSANCLNS